MHGNIISAPFGSRILSLSLGSYSTDRPCTAFSGTYQPTLFSFEISRLWLRRRRHRGRRGAASATSSSSIPNPLSLLPFLISPGLPITGRTDGRQWFNNPLKDYSFLRSNIPTKLNICHSRKKWGSKVRQMTQEAEKNCNSACRSSRNRNIKATCFVRSDDIALALLTGRGRALVRARPLQHRLQMHSDSECVVERANKRLIFCGAYIIRRKRNHTNQSYSYCRNGKEFSRGEKENRDCLLLLEGLENLLAYTVFLQWRRARCPSRPSHQLLNLARPINRQ